MKQYLKTPGLWVSIMALVISLKATAQLPEAYYGPATNTGTVSHGAGTGTNAFSINLGGSYDGFTYGTGTDNFVGPNGIAGAQEIGGIVAPIFNILQVNNGVGNALYITNTAGIKVNGSVAFNNGITTTLRTSRIAGLAAAIQFLGSAVYSPALTPAIGTDVVFTDGFVSKVNPVAFVYPVGNVTDLRPITATGTGTFATAWSNVNVLTPYPYTSSTLPIGTSALNTNGYWEWSGTATAAVTVSIPDQTAFTTATKLSVMGYNGTAWTNLGGVFATNTENSSNTAVVTVPATTQALAIGQTVPYVQVSPAAFLMGAMPSGATIMSRALDSLGLIPLSQPYNAGILPYVGTEILGALPLNMVDWILVDIRDSINPSTVIIATKAALLMTDGTITDVDGSSPVTFLNVTPGNYYVGLRHRNHLAIRSAAKLALSSTTTGLDFRKTLATAYNNTGAGYSNAPMKDIGDGNFGLWGGDVNGDGVVKYGGSQNDRTSLLVGCLSNNISIVSNSYGNCDVNLDGVSKYGGSGNDRTYLLVTGLGNDISTTLNTHL